MTDIKIRFTKTNIISQNTDPANAANKVIELEISTDYRMKQLEPRLDILHGGNPDNTFAKMRFYFLDNAEPKVYQALLNKNNFELSFDKEKVAYGVGGGAGPIDNTKPEVNLYQAPDSRMLEVYFSPQFAGIIKLVESGQTPPVPSPQPGPGTPPPPPNSPSLIQFTKKSAKKLDIGEPGAQAVEMETESFVLNFPRYGDKTFEKVVVIDNKNQNSDKLDFLLDNANQSVQINFLANARIDHLKHFELSMRNEQPNVDWRNGHEKELCIYLNDVFGFKPDQISFQKLDQKPAPNRLPGPSGPPQKNPPKPNSKDKKIRQLEARIRELEEKLRSQPNSPTRQNDQNELNRLKNELSSLKGNNNPQQPNKDKFPYWIVIGGGVIVVFVIGIAFWLGRRRRRHLKNS